MSEEEIQYLSPEEAAKIVGAIQEEEDINELNHRILTIYNKDDKELCWFDFEELLKDVNPGKGDDAKEMVSNYVMRHIPNWVLDM